MQMAAQLIMQVCVSEQVHTQIALLLCHNMRATRQYKNMPEAEFESGWDLCVT